MIEVNAPEPAPTTVAERVAAIDALRGFALLGVLLADLFYWSGMAYARTEELRDLGGFLGLRVFSRFYNFVLDGKFYTLFALVFGLAFTLQMDRLAKRGADAAGIFRRRMAVLLAIGIAHMLLLWDGDMLTLYALLGFVLPLFVRASDRALLVWAVLIGLAVPLAGMLVGQVTGLNPGAAMFDWAVANSRALGVDPLTRPAIPFIAGGGWHDWAVWQATGWSFTWGERLSTWRIGKVLGPMLLGMLAGRYLLRGQLLENRALLKRWTIGGFAIGIPVNLFYMDMHAHAQSSWQSLLGSVPMGIAYATGFLMLWPGDQRLLRVFAPAGRMALTNYLVQSLLGALVFYGIGLGLMGKLSMPWVYLYGIAVFSAQVWFSRWWLARHDHGPAEALWRRFSARA